MVFVVLCGPPPLVENASPIGKKKEKYSVHSIVRYQCTEGFLQRRLPTIKCHVNGLWENPKLLCTKREFLPSLSGTKVETADWEAQNSPFLFLPSWLGRPAGGLGKETWQRARMALRTSASQGRTGRALLPLGMKKSRWDGEGKERRKAPEYVDSHIEK